MKSKSQNIIRLFGMTGLQIESDKRSILQKYDLLKTDKFEVNEDFYNQFDLEIKVRAKKMSHHYELFYCLENSVRETISEVMLSKHKENWWTEKVDENIRRSIDERIDKEKDSGVTIRSERHVDYATFGELSIIIEKNWLDFSDLFTSKQAVKRIMNSLNTIRSPIAHCNTLAEDEIDRLNLLVKDWFRLMS